MCRHVVLLLQKLDLVAYFWKNKFPLMQSFKLVFGKVANQVREEILLQEI